MAHWRGRSRTFGARSRSSQGRPGGTRGRCPRLRGPEPARPIKIAVVLDPAGQGTAKQVQDGIRKAADALLQEGYVVDELEPPGIDAAAKALVVMLATPGIRAVWQQVMPPSLPAPTRRFMSAFFEAAGDPDAVAAERASSRQALLRSWSEFQEHHHPDPRPDRHRHPLQGGDRSGRRSGSRGPTNDAHGHGRQHTRATGRGAPGRRPGRSSQAVQIIGPRYREDMCLDAAAAIEGRLGTITPIDPR